MIKKELNNTLRNATTIGMTSFEKEAFKAQIKRLDKKYDDGLDYYQSVSGGVSILDGIIYVDKKTMQMALASKGLGIDNYNGIKPLIAHNTILGRDRNNALMKGFLVYDPKVAAKMEMV